MRPLLISCLPLLLLLIGVTAHEIRTYIVADTVVGIGLVAGLALSRFAGLCPWWSHWAAAVCCPLILYAGSVVWEKSTGMVMIGMGIVKLSAVVGAFVGLSMGLTTTALFILLTIIVYLAGRLGGPVFSHGTPILLGSVILSILLYAFLWPTLNHGKPPNQASEATPHKLGEPQR